MTVDGKYANLVATVKEECKDASEEEIAEEFRRYEEEFLIPPEDALRSVIRKFQTIAGIDVTGSSSARAPPPSEKKVDRFADLGSDDRNVTVEVAVVSYTPRMQKMKNGEERQIAFGWIEDKLGSPATRERDYKDWGGS